jgi:hypothetical protein
VKSQVKKLFYDVIRNNKKIGNLTFVESTNGQKKILNIVSEVKTSYIFSFSDNTSETAIYENGVLTYSSFYQKQTGSGEVNKTTTTSGKFYKVTNNGDSKLVNLSPIHFGMLRLYINVPDTITKVFSGNYQQMLDIKKIAENKYRLALPDEKYNYYTYKNGVCAKVEIVRSLVSLQFVLRE